MPSTASFAQTWCREEFSDGGKEELRKIVGLPISTIDDLAAAIRKGIVSPADIPVDYIVKEGHIIIHNTRTAQTLMEAGIPRSEWNAIDKSAVPEVVQRVMDQLERNHLGLAGNPTVEIRH